MKVSCFSAEGDLYFTTKLQNYTAVERDEVKLVCELSKAIADVKWFKDGKEITPSKNIAISTDGKKRILMVRKAEKANIGEYTCDCGSDKTTAKLNIEGNPAETREGNVQWRFAWILPAEYLDQRVDVYAFIVSILSQDFTK